MTFNRLWEYHQFSACQTKKGCRITNTLNFFGLAVTRMGITTAHAQQLSNLVPSPFGCLALGREPSAFKEMLFYH